MWFEAGYSCSQSVLGVFADDFSLPHPTAMKLTTAFGGGLAGCGEICGALSGALMVIGLRFGRVIPDDFAAKEKTYESTLEILKSFESKHGSLLCRYLRIEDRSTPAREKAAHEKCSDYVRDIVLLLEKLFKGASDRN